MVRHKPEEHFPLMAFGLLASFLVVSQLMEITGVRATAFSSYIGLLACLSSVMLIVRHWRYGEQ